MQQNGKSVAATPGEIEQVTELQMYISVVKLPTYNMYWESLTRFDPIVDAMPRNRYQLLRNNLHVSDNLKRDDSENKSNKLYKTEPVLEHIRKNYLDIENEQKHSIDKQVIPAKTSHSGIRQYNPKQPVKWGFKNLVRSGESGIIYDFFLYSGSAGGQKCTGFYVVLKLLETLPKK